MIVDLFCYFLENVAFGESLKIFLFHASRKENQ